jgi:threonylcarbamoyladenosine tRNA methylthiotransferase MtaB
MRIFFDQIGCRLNYSEMETLAGQLRHAGHTIVAAPEQAQVVLFNSCAVTAGAERDSRKRLAALHRASPQARIAVTGCWATLRPQQAAALPGVALVADNRRKEMLFSLLEPWSAELDDADALAHMQPGRHNCSARWLQTHAGTRQRAGWLQQPPHAARGSRSRRRKDVVAEVQRAAEAGVMEALTAYPQHGRDRSMTRQRSQSWSPLYRNRSACASAASNWELSDGFFDSGRAPSGFARICIYLQAARDNCAMAALHDCQLPPPCRGRAAIPIWVTTDLIGFLASAMIFAEGLAFVEEMCFTTPTFSLQRAEGTAGPALATNCPPR